MDEPVIFLLTPRAGSRNHRYIVPTGVSWSQEMLAKKADDVIHAGGRATDYLSAQRDVIQPTTGRPASEWTILHDSKLRRAGPATRDRLQAAVNEWSKTVDGILGGVDWDSDGKDLLIHRPELLDWQKECIRILQTGRREGARIKRSVALMRARCRQSFAMLSRCARSTRSVALVIGGCLVLLVITWFLGVGPWDRIWEFIGPRATSEKTLKDFQSALAEVLAISEADPQKRDDTINGKLKGLFKQIPDESAGQGRQPLENNAKSILEAVATLNGLNTPTEKELLELAEKLFPKPNGELDRAGLISDPIAKVKLANLDPVKLRLAGLTLARLESSNDLRLFSKDFPPIDLPPEYKDRPHLDDRDRQWRACNVFLKSDETAEAQIRGAFLAIIERATNVKANEEGQDQTLANLVTSNNFDMDSRESVPYYIDWILGVKDGEENTLAKGLTLFVLSVKDAVVEDQAK